MSIIWTQEHYDTGKVTQVTYAQVENYLCRIGGLTHKEARRRMNWVITRRLKSLATENAAFRREPKVEAA